MSMPTEVPPENDDLLLIELGPDTGPDPSRHRRRIVWLVTIGWVAFISVLCAYVLMKW